MSGFCLQRDPFGSLVLLAEGLPAQRGVQVVRAFPIAAPQEGISLLGADGHELLWLDTLDEVDSASRALLQEELATREFMPEIKRLLKVSSFATPSTWSVETDRGTTQFVLRGEEDIRRLTGGTLLVADSHGIQFIIRDLYQLDRHSRRLLDRFL